MISALLRLIILSGVAPLLFLSFLVPLFGTVLPIWRAGRTVSWELLGRLMLRGALALLAGVHILFVLEEVRSGLFVVEVLRWARALCWPLIGAGAVVSWLTHQEGIKGL